MKSDAPLYYMNLALEQAQLAFAQQEVPVGAVLVRQGQILSAAYNSREADKDPFAHAEIKVVRQAVAVIGDWRLQDCDLYVTLEPCLMCLGTLLQARVRALYFGAFDDKRLAHPHFPSLKNLLDSPQTVLHLNHHSMQVTGGVLQQQSEQILKDFFKQQRLV